MAPLPTSSRLSCALSPLRRLATVLLSLVALFLTFYGLFQWDVPLTRFIRSLNDVQLDHLSNPWLAHLSDVGDRLGKGESLLLLSAVILVAGWAFRHPAWKAAGWQSLLAHGLAGMSSNLLKHLVGRPRPKFMHAGSLDLSPVSGSGWDSFPSGHAAASFAVATVFAVRFPKMRWIILALAGAIAVSRTLRGSHFLTDVAGGAVIGYLAGTIAATPLRQWSTSLKSALIPAASWSAGLLVLVWTMAQPLNMTPAWAYTAGGLAVTSAGLALHVFASFSKDTASRNHVSKSEAHSLIGLGIGLMTGSLLVTASVLCAGLGYVLSGHEKRSASVDQVWGYAKEFIWVTIVLAAVLVVVELRGVLPMR